MLFVMFGIIIKPEKNEEYFTAYKVIAKSHFMV